MQLKRTSSDNNQNKKTVAKPRLNVELLSTGILRNLNTTRQTTEQLPVTQTAIQLPVTQFNFHRTNISSSYELARVDPNFEHFSVITSGISTQPVAMPQAQAQVQTVVLDDVIRGDQFFKLYNQGQLENVFVMGDLFTTNPPRQANQIVNGYIERDENITGKELIALIQEENPNFEFYYIDKSALDVAHKITPEILLTKGSTNKDIKRKFLKDFSAYIVKQRNP